MDYSLVAEMVLNTALINFRIDKIRTKLRSLRDGNKEDFLKLTEELKKIC